MFWYKSRQTPINSKKYTVKVSYLAVFSFERLCRLNKSFNKWISFNHKQETTTFQEQDTALTMATLKQRVDLKINGENLLSEGNYCTKFDNFQAKWSKDIVLSKFVQTQEV